MHVMSDDDQTDPERQKASKHQLELYTKEADMDDEEAIRFLRTHLGWKDWFLYDYSRYWYAAGALLLDCLVLLTLADGLTPIDWVDAIAVVLTSIGLVFLEALLFLMIWPKGVFTDRVSVRRAFKRWLRHFGR